MSDEKATIEIDILALAKAVWKKIWLVIIVAVIGTAAMFSYANFFITPQYSAKALMYVNNSSVSLGNTSFSITSGDLSAAQSLVKTYIVILKSRETLNTVIQRANLKYSYEQLVNMVSAQAVNDTQVFEISVTNNDPYESELIANTIAEVLPDKISKIIEGSSVKIVDYAVVPAVQVSPNVTKYAMMGFLAGCILSVGFIVLLELLNDSVRSEEYLIQTYGLPILAIVPTMESEVKAREKRAANHRKSEQKRRTNN